MPGPEEREAAAIPGTAPRLAEPVPQPAPEKNDIPVVSEPPQPAKLPKSSKHTKSKRQRAKDDSESTAETTPSEDESPQDNRVTFKRHPLDRRPKKKKVRAFDRQSPLRRLRRHPGSAEDVPDIRTTPEESDSAREAGTATINPASLPPNTDSEDPPPTAAHTPSPQPIDPLSNAANTDTEDPPPAAAQAPSPQPIEPLMAANNDAAVPLVDCANGNSSVILSSPPVCATWPKWFSLAYSYLLDHSTHLGTSWACVLHALVNLEADHGFQNSKASLPNVGNRPPAISLWIKNARVRSPAISDVSVYETQWWRWWRALQPDWRSLSTTEGPISAVDSLMESLNRPSFGGSFALLDCHGSNGFLSVVGSLRFWGDEVHSQFEKNSKNSKKWLEHASAESWNRAVSEVTRLMVGLWLEKGGEERQQARKILLGPYGAVYAEI